MSRSAVAAKRRKQKIRYDDFTPKIAEGITIGGSVEEALKAHPIKPITPLDKRIGHMKGEDLGRVRFVAEPNEALVTLQDGRTVRDVDTTMTAETKARMQAGYMCLRCFEPHDSPFPKFCSLCGYPMKDRQILDLALEFEGEKHLGPRRPMREFADAQDERHEKRKFFRRLLTNDRYEEAARMAKADPSLLDGLTPRERRALRAA